MSYVRREGSPTVLRISPQNRYHSQVYNISPPKDFSDYSTADRYGLDDGQRKFEELVQQNLWLKEQIDRKRAGHSFENHPLYIQNIHQQNYQRGIPIGGDRTKNDMILWGMIQRNKYLEDKLNKLRQQQQKQAVTIRKIQQSDEWLNRHQCVPSKCYCQRYLQLLRVRSPFF